MKILCVSDQIDPLIYSTNAHKNFPDIDLILCAGDLPMDYIDFIVTVFNKPTYFVFGNHNLEEFKYYHGRQTFSAPTPSVQGVIPQSSYDKDKMETPHHGAIYAGFKHLKLKFLHHQFNGKASPLLMVGLSGSIRYNNGLCQYTDLEMFLKLLWLTPRLLYNKIKYGRYLDIFLTHATPFDIHDLKDPCHTGFKCYCWFLKKFKPTYMIHGHVHLYDSREERIGKYYDTTVVNAYAHVVIEL